MTVGELYCINNLWRGDTAVLFVDPDREERYTERFRDIITGVAEHKEVWNREVSAFGETMIVLKEEQA